MVESMHFVDVKATSYARETALLNTFTQEIDSLYLLSLLLTADHEKAEQCLIGAMGECVEELDISWDRARSGARQAVLKYAIRMMMPVPEPADSFSLPSFKGPVPSTDNGLAAILKLGEFERFVFVMSILEGRSQQECALLLRCSRQDVMAARVLALKHLGNSDAARVKAEQVLQA
jgi:hypothetical protein